VNKLFILLFLCFNLFASKKNKSSLSEQDRLIYMYSENMSLKDNIVLDLDRANETYRKSKKIIQARKNTFYARKKKENSEVTKKDGFGKNFPFENSKVIFKSFLINKNRYLDYFYISFKDNGESIDSQNSQIKFSDILSGNKAERELEITSFDGMRTMTQVRMEKGSELNFNIPVFDKIDFYTNILDEIENPLDTYLLIKKEKGSFNKISINKKNKKIYFNENFKKIDSFNHATYLLIVMQEGLIKVDFHSGRTRLRKNYHLEADTVFYDDVKIKKGSISYSLQKDLNFKVWGKSKISYKRDKYNQIIENERILNGKNYWSLVKGQKQIKAASLSEDLPFFSEEKWIKIQNLGIYKNECITQLNFTKELDFIDYDFNSKEREAKLDLFSEVNGKLVKGIQAGANKAIFISERDYLLHLGISYLDGSIDYVRSSCDTHYLIERM